MSKPVSPRSVAASLSEYWSPRVIAEFDDSYVKVVKVKGTFAWHAHDQEDELFFILKGRLRIELGRYHAGLRFTGRLSRLHLPTTSARGSIYFNQGGHIVRRSRQSAHQGPMVDGSSSRHFLARGVPRLR